MIALQQRYLKYCEMKDDRGHLMFFFATELFRYMKHLTYDSFDIISLRFSVTYQLTDVTLIVLYTVLLVPISDKKKIVTIIV